MNISFKMETTTLLDEFINQFLDEEEVNHLIIE